MTRKAPLAGTPAPLAIGALARAAGIGVETVRYYQRRGLVPRPPRPAGGTRRYPPDTVDRLRFIRRAQQLGFSLREIDELLRLGDGHCRDVRARAEAKRTQIAAQLRDLAALQRTLDRLIASCHGAGQAPPCPIVEALSQPSAVTPRRSGARKSLIKTKII